MRSIKFMAVAAASAFVAMAAHANTYNLGLLDVNHPIAAPAAVGVGAFDDVLNFSVNTAGTVGSATVANNLSLGGVGSNTFSITDGLVKLFNKDSNTLVGSYSFDGTTGSSTSFFNSISSGNYFFEVSGNANGAFGGLYTLTANIAPVPEPETYALMGLGLVALVAARRKKRA